MSHYRRGQPRHLTAVDRNEGGENHTVCNNDTVLAFYRFFCHSFGEVNCKQDRVHLAANCIERCFEKDYNQFSASISPIRLVGQRYTHGQYCQNFGLLKLLGSW